MALTLASIGERLEGLLDETFPAFPDAVATSAEHCAFFDLVARRLERAVEMERQAGEAKLCSANLGTVRDGTVPLMNRCRASLEKCPKEAWRGPGRDCSPQWPTNRDSGPNRLSSYD